MLPHLWKLPEVPIPIKKLVNIIRCGRISKLTVGNNLYQIYFNLFDAAVHKLSEKIKKPYSTVFPSANRCFKS